MSKVRETVLEINLEALEANYRYLRSKLRNNTKFLAVVKAYAYGSDPCEVALKLEQIGADYFAVAYTTEGMALRKAGVTKPILVLHPLPVHFEELIEYCLEPALYNLKVLKEFLEAAENKKVKDYPVHLKFNTGLNRLGFWENDTDSILNVIRSSEALKITSMFSHLAASEDHNEKEFSLEQIARFEKIAGVMASGLGYQPMRHMLNTSGILNYADRAQFEMVRSGIGLYGFGNEEKYDKQLQPVVALKSVISQIHMIEPGESVGYNRKFTADGYTKTATIPLGHADGIGRIYGNKKGFLTVNGQKAPIIGNVCMDMLMIDITGIECKEGDEVVVFGKNPTAATFAATGGTISYELITAISQRVKRTFIK
ncbi:alanine racemase [Robertkochia marina]|uniref:Alanine racemase n=1 Tax=Robertkochia marina TaxID=1227945 RepID=A0A4S3M3F4_9FLAO|nr:alanine racemase [Robertkochia marina]THD69229.1 alanine racemase [Robertkochia marina]TRZ47512.1 alanine racemase [Robertkochia marina]